MWNIIASIRGIIFGLLPFVLFYAYVKYVYDSSLLKLPLWWFKHYSEVENSGAILFSFVFFLLIVPIPINALLNTAYFGLFGSKQEYVYLGNSGKAKGVYYQLSDQEKRPVETIEPKRTYNKSFHNLYLVYDFIDEPGTSQRAGLKANLLHPYAILSKIGLLVFLVICFIVILHVFAYPMLCFKNGQNLADIQPGVAFDAILAQFHLTRQVFALIGFAGLLVGVLFYWMLPDAPSRPAVTPLPSQIKAGNTINGLPVEIDIVYEQRSERENLNNSGDNVTKTVDTGRRFVTFQFNKLFNPPVYVSMEFNEAEYPELEKTLRQSITSTKPYPLYITDTLGISPLPRSE